MGPGRRHFNNGKTYQFRDYLPGRNFSWGHFNVTPAGHCLSHKATPSLQLQPQ